MTPLDHLLIGRSFDRHAGEYDTRVVVQKRVTARLDASLEREKISLGRILDVGCGTGNLLALLRRRYPGVDLAGLDLAPGMLAAAGEKLADDPRLLLAEGDAERLPFADATFDLVVSTSTYQWLDDLSTAFREAYRVLRPGALFRFALFGAGTLRELRESYAEAERSCGFETGARTHSFKSAADVAAALTRAGFIEAEAVSEIETELYPTVPDLLRAVKGAGAATPAAPVSRGLAERRVMLAMMAIYRDRFGGADGIPATYEVIYGRGVRPA